MKSHKAVIITIGDELLIGQTIDTNSAWMAKELNLLGIDITERIAVGDVKLDIIRALDNSLEIADIVLITGGLGPTADDITKPLLCEYFKGKLMVNKAALENVKTIFQKRNLPLLERNLKQAEVPDVCTVLQNKKGTAPGMWFEKDGKIVISMPGVPHEMIGMMEDEVLPRLRKSASDGYYILHRNILTAGIGESFLAEKIVNIEASLPQHIKLAYLPANWMVKLRLTAKGNDKKTLTEEINYYRHQLISAIKEYVIASKDEPLEKILYSNFSTRKLTLAIAESCTGGYIGHTLTQVEGSSEFFVGSIVSYDISVKKDILGIAANDIVAYGEVSEAVAVQMAENVRRLLKADIGFGITGWLSNSAKQNDNETGTVWMAVCDKQQTKTQKYYFPYDRLRNKEMALQMALLMIWKFINGKEI